MFAKMLSEVPLVHWAGAANCTKYARVLKFMASQRRDASGRWVSGGGFGTSPASDLATKQNRRDYSVDEVVARALGNDPEVIARYYDSLKEVDDDVAAGLETNRLNTKNGDGTGGYTSQRLELHTKILDHLLAKADACKPPEGTAPTFIMLGGRGGSGKSNLSKEVDPKFGVYSDKTSLVVDCDAIKEMLPEYVPSKAYLVHRESSHIADKLMAEARKRGLNVVLDATMHRSVEPMLRRFARKGYEAEAHFMHKKPEWALSGAVHRWNRQSVVKNPITGTVKTYPHGRLVPPVIIEANLHNEANFDAVSKKVRAYSLVTNESEFGFQGREVASAVRKVEATPVQSIAPAYLSVLKANPYHDKLGRFTTVGGAVSRPDEGGGLGAGTEATPSVPLAKAPKPGVFLGEPARFDANGSPPSVLTHHDFANWNEMNSAAQDLVADGWVKTKTFSLPGSAINNSVYEKGEDRVVTWSHSPDGGWTNIRSMIHVSPAENAGPGGVAEKAPKHFWKFMSKEAGVEGDGFSKGRDLKPLSFKEDYVGRALSEGVSFEGVKPVDITKNKARQAKYFKKVGEVNSTLSDEEKVAVREYTEGEYSLINKAAAAAATGDIGAKVSKKTLKSMALMDAAFDKSTLQEDLKVVRFVKTDRFLQKMGIRGGTLAGRTPEQLQEMVGKSFYEPGYSSTAVNVAEFDWNPSRSGTGDSDTGAVKFVINTKKGQKGIDTSGLSSNWEENEVVLPRGAAFVISKVQAQKDGVELVVEMEYRGSSAAPLPVRKVESPYARVLKANPYHDASGKFSSKEKAGYRVSQMGALAKEVDQYSGVGKEGQLAMAKAKENYAKALQHGASELDLQTAMMHSMASSYTKAVIPGPLTAEEQMALKNLAKYKKFSATNLKKLEADWYPKSYSNYADALEAHGPNHSITKKAAKDLNGWYAQAIKYGATEEQLAAMKEKADIDYAVAHYGELSNAKHPDLPSKAKPKTAPGGAPIQPDTSQPVVPPTPAASGNPYAGATKFKPTGDYDEAIQQHHALLDSYYKAAKENALTPAHSAAVLESSNHLKQTFSVDGTALQQMTLRAKDKSLGHTKATPKFKPPGDYVEAVQQHSALLEAYHKAESAGTLKPGDSLSTALLESTNHLKNSFSIDVSTLKLMSEGAKAKVTGQPDAPQTPKPAAPVNPPSAPVNPPKATPKFKGQPTESEALEENKALGEHYYTLREELGQSHPDVQAAYAEWDKAKSHLKSKYSYATDAIGKLSAGYKETAHLAYVDKTNKEAQIKAGHAKGIFDAAKASELSKGANGFTAIDAAIAKAKAEGVSQTDIDLALKMGKTSAVEHVKQAKEAASSELKSAASAMYASFDKNGSNDPETADAVMKYQAVALNHAKTFTPEELDDLTKEGKAHAAKMAVIEADAKLKYGEAGAKAVEYDKAAASFKYPGSNNNSFYNHGTQEVNKLTPKEKAVVKGYTYDDFTTTNKAVGAAGTAVMLGNTPKPLTDKVKERMTAMDSAFAKTTLGQNVKLKRHAPQKYFWDQLKIPLDFADNMTDKELKDSLVGQVYKETAFGSTSTREDWNSCYSSEAEVTGRITYNIRATADMPGLPAKSISNSAGEDEVILPRGTTYIVRDVRRKYASYGHMLGLEVDVDMIGAFPDPL